MGCGVSRGVGRIDKLLLATRNRGKLREYRALLAGVPFAFTTLDDEGILERVEEDGGSFEENASLKARRYAALSGLLTLADDSGLEVDALGGEPGTRSARYAGDSASDGERVKLLLARMSGVPWERRTARFRCVISLSNNTTPANLLLTSSMRFSLMSKCQISPRSVIERSNISSSAFSKSTSGRIDISSGNRASGALSR